MRERFPEEVAPQEQRIGRGERVVRPGKRGLALLFPMGLLGLTDERDQIGPVHQQLSTELVAPPGRAPEGWSGDLRPSALQQADRLAVLATFRPHLPVVAPAP